MAKIFQPIMPAAATPTYVKQGVEDKSGGYAEAGHVGVDNSTIIKDTGGLLGEAYKGYELARIEREQEAVNQDYMDRRAPIGAPVAEPVNIFGKPGEPIVPNQKETQDKIASYQRAKDAGIMSPEEFATRTLAVTREAVNRSPHLFPELIKHSQKVLGLSGIEDVLKTDAATREYQMKKALEDDKREADAAFKIGGPALVQNPLRAQIISDHHSKMTMFEMFTKADGYNDIQRKGIINNPKMLNDLFTGASTTLTVYGNMMIEDKVTPVAQKVLMLDQQYSAERSKLVTSFGTNAGDAVIKENLAALDKTYAMYKSMVDGSAPAEMAKNFNEFKVATESSRLELYKTLPLLPYFNAMGDLGKMDLKKTGAFDKIVNVLNGTGVNGFDWNRGNTSQDLVGMGKAALDQAKTDPTNLGKMAESYHNSVVDPKLEPETRRKIISTFAETMAAKGAHEVVSKLPVEMRSQLLSDTKLYLGELAGAIKTKTTYPDNTPVVRPADLLITTMGDSIIFSSQSNPDAAAKMTRVYGKEINNVIGTMANLNGHGDVKTLLKDKESGLVRAFHLMAGGGTNVAGEDIPNRRASDTVKIDPKAIPDFEAHAKQLEARLATAGPVYAPSIQKELAAIRQALQVAKNGVK